MEYKGVTKRSYDEEMVREIVHRLSEWMNADLSEQEEERMVREIVNDQKILDCKKFL